MKTNSKKFSIKDWFEKNKLYILEEKKLKELKEKSDLLLDSLPLQY